jgi:ectoine hydroxylase-related dioxygenase (phytanoyl-CoA dioxygenase family)
MDMATTLAELGVTASSIDSSTRQRLDEDGYVPLPGVLTGGQVQAIRARLAELTAAEGDEAGLEVHQEAGTDRLADLVNKDPIFEICFTHPAVLAAVAHVLGEFRLSSLNSRAVRPGQGHQPLHADWGGPVPPPGYQVCNSIWLLDDFTSVNGATRVVPGSHRLATHCRIRPPPTLARCSCSPRQAPSSSSTATCGTAAPTTAASSRAVRCTATSPDAVTRSNWTRRDTCARAPPPG